MAITVSLTHRTVYAYDRAVSLSPQVIRLRPAPHARTRIPGYALRITPERHFINWQQDPQGNWLARVVFPEPVQRFEVCVELAADLTVVNPFDFFVEESAEHWPFAYDPAAAHELAPYLLAEPGMPLLDALAAGIERPKEGRGTVSFLVELNRKLQERVRYLIRMEPGVQSPDETLEKSSGSCRDSAWLMVQLLRRLGIAARFASGYLVQLVADQKPIEGAEGPGQDFTDLHAWCEAYLPGAGWIGFDPTSGLMAGEGHIPLACTPDPGSAAPITGSYAFTPRDEDDEVTCEFDVQMEVRRLIEPPRTTKPYDAATAAAIDACGRLVDERLEHGDVRLTMGGEPTFISIDDYDHPQWNVDALGDDKQRLARDLSARLKAAFAAGGALHQGQGKWYPGEQLPRWAYTVLWRNDGVPVWERDDLIAHHASPRGAGPTHARTFAAALARRLGLDADAPTAAFEDAWYHLWRERRLPVNVDPLDSRLEDPLERDRLARIFRQGLGTVVGYALPLDHRLGQWVSGPWRLRDERLYLVPGDSPMGYRLPLETLPWVAPGDRVVELPPDPTVRRDRLPAHAPVRAQVQGQAAPERGQSAPSTVTTALCVEARKGTLHVFLPPLVDAAAWLDLVAQVEAVAADLGLPVALEGYLPPHDDRLRSLQVTPDPGVIEVNIHPSASWDALTAVTRRVYHEARANRLTTEKFQLDGRHIGTGGGNHITLGGASALDSPFLRRPDLLASLLGYWHNHPGLSYLFSGLFIGPTSQAPRADEARTDTVHELQLAIDQIRPGASVPPGLVDRVFRNILTDATGNTHRAEFSIDKLYSPDGPSGRRGLVEMRAFEMPPHADMACAQLLLVRALVARFWERPYRTPLARWGTQLADKWMLPWALWEDVREVLRELRDEGLPLMDRWFEPHREFRFPIVGHLAERGLELTLRTALEPWHVLGEESGPGGTARFVDASVERLEVLVRGLSDRRHAVTVNGQPLPLRPTGVAGEAVCGVRFRAWQPPSCLHPTIPVDGPLVFDLVDTWNGRAIAGCTYHVAHPGGRSYATRPVNAAEAEARRAARFQPFGFGQGPRRVLPSVTDPHFPWTLDLRR